MNYDASLIITTTKHRSCRRWWNKHEQKMNKSRAILANSSSFVQWTKISAKNTLLLCNVQCKNLAKCLRASKQHCKKKENTNQFRERLFNSLALTGAYRGVPMSIVILVKSTESKFGTSSYVPSTRSTPVANTAAAVQGRMVVSKSNALNRGETWTWSGWEPFGNNSAVPRCFPLSSATKCRPKGGIRESWMVRWRLPSLSPIVQNPLRLLRACKDIGMGGRCAAVPTWEAVALQSCILWSTNASGTHVRKTKIDSVSRLH